VERTALSRATPLNQSTNVF